MPRDCCLARLVIVLVVLLSSGFQVEQAQSSGGRHHSSWWTKSHRPSSGAILSRNQQHDSYEDQQSGSDYADLEQPLVQQRAASSNRFDLYYGDLRAEEDFEHQNYREMEHQHKSEVKEVSYIYPLLLALLILGALFLPFISLFFFLSVSAFNCGQSGLAQVTPVFGRRRRRRRKRQLEQEGQQQWERQDLLAQLPLAMLFDSAYEPAWPAGEQPSGGNKTWLIERQQHLFEDDEFSQLDRRLADGTRLLWQALSDFGAQLMRSDI